MLDFSTCVILSFSKRSSFSSSNMSFSAFRRFVMIFISSWSAMLDCRQLISSYMFLASCLYFCRELSIFSYSFPRDFFYNLRLPEPLDLIESWESFLDFLLDFLTFFLSEVSLFFWLWSILVAEISNSSSSDSMAMSLDAIVFSNWFNWVRSYLFSSSNLEFVLWCLSTLNANSAIYFLVEILYCIRSAILAVANSLVPEPPRTNFLIWLTSWWSTSAF